jgi:hypothetical protein
MTVGELITQLHGFDPDLLVYVRGYEKGIDDVTEVAGIAVVRDSHDTYHWYYGAHAIYDPDLHDSDVTTNVTVVPGIYLGAGS